MITIAAAVRLESQGGLQRLSDISIELKLLQSRVLVQESLLATTTLVNHGSAVVATPAADGPSPFVYELRPAQANQAVRVVSSQGAREATSRGTPQQRRPLPFNLGPGRSLPRAEDLAALAVRPFAPAMYTVTVHADTPDAIGPSTPSRVQVTPPQPVIVSSALEPTYDRRLAFANAEEDGTFGILALADDAASQESAVFFRANVQDRKPRPESIAVSVPTSVDANTRWVAWTSGGTLFATKDWGVPVARTVLLRAALPAPGGRVLSPGYFFADDTGLFVILNGSTLQAFRLTPEALVKAWSASVTPGLERARIRYSGGSNGEGVLQLLTISNQQGRRQLRLQAWNVKDGREVVPLRDIAEIPLPVVAWSLPVVGKGRADRLELITGPTAEGGFVHSSFVLEKNTVRVPDQLIPAIGGPSDEYAMAVAGNGKIFVVARTAAGQVVALQLPGTGWTTVTDKVPAGHLDAYANYDRAWVEWLDPEFGFRRSRLSAE
jgi:hypothetical protein